MADSQPQTFAPSARLTEWFVIPRNVLQIIFSEHSPHTPCKIKTPSEQKLACAKLQHGRGNELLATVRLDEPAVMESNQRYYRAVAIDHPDPEHSSSQIRDYPESGLSPLHELCRQTHQEEEC